MTKVLKIGGSILTDKTQTAFARIEVIDRISREIAQCSSDLILIHGAGSYGHVHAKKYGLPERFDPYGLLATHTSVVQLNKMIVDALSEAGADPMPVHPFQCTVLRNGRIDRMEITPVKEMIKRGLLPVLHGDVAMDVARGSGIVSGDQLVTYLARAFNADIVGLGTDVDGVICEGKCLDKVTMGDLERIDLGTGKGVDVTGGMRGKLTELLDLAEHGIESVIFNAGKSGLIEKVLMGERVGTVVGMP
jgi:isopentenyl phosphate kinase